MKVRVLHVVFLLSVPAFVFANPPFGGGTDRVVKDIVGGGATIYHADGTTSRYNANPLGGGGTIYHTGGRTDRVVEDIVGGGATIHHSGGTTSRYNANPLGGGGTIYHSGGRTDRVVEDIVGGGATIHHSDGTTSRYNASPLGGGGTIYHSGGAPSTYGYGRDAFGMGVQAPSAQSYASPAYGIPSPPDLGAEISPVDMPLSSYQNGSSSRPFIEGYRYIGDGQSGGSSLGDAAAAAAAEIALKAILEAGLRSAQEHFNTKPSYADESSPYESSNRQSQKARCPFRVSLIIVLIVGSLCLWASKKNKEVSRLCKKALSVPTTVINWAFGRKCEVVRDSQGELVSIKMPKSIIIPLVVTYIVCAVPSVISLFTTDIHTVWIACLIPMLIPISLDRGKIFARRVVVFFCVCVIIITALVRALTEEECGELGAWLCFDGVALFSCSLIAMLRLPQSNEWFLAKKEMSSVAIRKMKNRLKAKADRVFGSAVFVFAGKWYLWIAAVLIVICFVVIFRGLFSPLSSNAADAGKPRMAQGHHERLKQIEKPDVQDSVSLP